MSPIHSRQKHTETDTAEFTVHQYLLVFYLTL